MDPSAAPPPDARPWIGLTARTLPLNSAGKPRPTETVPRTYVDAVEAAGGRAWILPNTGPEHAVAYAERLDGLVLTGGDDPHPHLWGEEPHPGIERVDERRDRFEIALARAALARDLPLLGVCRGVQLLNIARGGDIWQDIASQTGSLVRHGQTRIDDGPWHRIEITPGSLLAGLVGDAPRSVNSFHHQACRSLGAGLVASARCPTDGLVEALEDPDARFVLGIQWHAELDVARGEPAGRAVFEGLVTAARRDTSASSNPRRPPPDGR